MKTLPLLNYSLAGTGQPILLIHGLFGSLDNLGVLARQLQLSHQVISLDLRNHGRSFHHPEHNYTLMAQDVAALIHHLSLEKITVIGHSMGGKVAIKLTQLCPELIQQLIILDMAPVAYHVHRHEAVFAGLTAVEQQKPNSRTEALNVLAHYIQEEGVRQFLGKSLVNQDSVMRWRFNLSALKANYANILNWQPIPPFQQPTLFIKGALSDYLTVEHQPEIQRQFTQAKAHIVANTGHWLHAEKPQEVLRSIHAFLTRKP